MYWLMSEFYLHTNGRGKCQNQKVNKKYAILKFISYLTLCRVSAFKFVVQWKLTEFSSHQSINKVTVLGTASLQWHSDSMSSQNVQKYSSSEVLCDHLEKNLQILQYGWIVLELAMICLLQVYNLSKQSQCVLEGGIYRDDFLLSLRQKGEPPSR